MVLTPHEKHILPHVTVHIEAAYLEGFTKRTSQLEYGTAYTTRLGSYLITGHVLKEVAYSFNKPAINCTVLHNISCHSIDVSLYHVQSNLPVELMMCRRDNICITVKTRVTTLAITYHTGSRLQVACCIIYTVCRRAHLYAHPHTTLTSHGEDPVLMAAYDRFFFC